MILLQHTLTTNYVIPSHERTIQNAVHLICSSKCWFEQLNITWMQENAWLDSWYVTCRWQLWRHRQHFILTRMVTRCKIPLTMDRHFVRIFWLVAVPSNTLYAWVDLLPRTWLCEGTWDYLGKLSLGARIILKLGLNAIWGYGLGSSGSW